MIYNLSYLYFSCIKLVDFFEILIFLLVYLIEIRIYRWFYIFVDFDKKMEYKIIFLKENLMKLKIYVEGLECCLW